MYIRCSDSSFITSCVKSFPEQTPGNMQSIFRLAALALLAAAVVQGFPAHLPESPDLPSSEPLDPNHVPQSVCQSMVPEHGDSKPQSGQVPYTITVSKAKVAPGETIQVTVRGEGVTEFKGIYIQARDGETPVGVWQPSDNPSVVVSDCPPGEHNAASYISRTGLRELVLSWTAPQTASTITIRTTIVKQYSEFWVGVLSQSFRIE